MNAPVDTLQRYKNQTIAAAFGLNLLFGALLVTLFPGLMDPASVQGAMEELRGSAFYLGYQLSTLAVCFLWLGLDSRQLGIRRPWWLNVGIVFLTSIFVAYYLYKTRPAGQRGQAILALLGVIFGCMFATMAGAFMAMSMHGAPAA